MSLGFDFGSGALSAASTALDVWKMGRASDEAEFARDWQANQRATQYQTAVADMRAAGLNPALAYMQGGAGNLSGAVADVPSGNPIATAMEVRNLSRSADKIFEETQLTNRLENIKRLEQDVFRDTMPALVEKAKAEASSAKSVAELNKMAIPEAKATSDMWKKFAAEGKAAGFILPFIKSIFQAAGSLSIR